jgi:hypothetical protein
MYCGKKQIINPARPGSPTREVFQARFQKNFELLVGAGTPPHEAIIQAMTLTKAEFSSDLPAQ